MDNGLIDSILSVATEENLAKIEAEIARLTLARDVIRKMLGKGAKPKYMPPFRTVGHDTQAAKIMFYLAGREPERVADVSRGVGLGESHIASILCRFPHFVKVKSPKVGWVLSDIGKKWVEENAVAASH